MPNVQEIIPFLFKIREFHLVYRATREPDNRFESDAEHSWSAAMTGVLILPYLEKEFSQKIDKEKILTMLLIHDLAEMKTGDTKTWDSLARIGKEEKEKMAISELFGMLPKGIGDNLKEIWGESEKQESIEAKIVKSIDRMDPVIHRVSSGFGWKDVEDNHNTVEALNERQLPRHNFSKVMMELFMEIRKIAEEKNLF